MSGLSVRTVSSLPLLTSGVRSLNVSAFGAASIMAFTSPVRFRAVRPAGRSLSRIIESPAEPVNGSALPAAGRLLIMSCMPTPETSSLTLRGSRTYLQRQGHGEPLLFLHSEIGASTWTELEERLS